MCIYCIYYCIESVAIDIFTPGIGGKTKDIGGENVQVWSIEMATTELQLYIEEDRSKQERDIYDYSVMREAEEERRRGREMGREKEGIELNWIIVMYFDSYLL